MPAALAAQIKSAGGVPLQLGIAPDRKDVLQEMIERGLDSDLLAFERWRFDG